MIELLLFRFLLERDNYRQHRHYVKFTKELEVLLSVLDSWYKNNTEAPKLEDLLVILAVEVEKDQEYLQEVLKRALSLEIPKDIGRLVEQQKIAVIAEKLTLQAFQLSRGEIDVQEVIRTARDLEIKEEAATSFVTSDIEQILQATVQHRGLRWRLPWLNRSLGSLRRGDFGFIFARPETGKTTFLADQATFMAPQSNGPILWFNNEEQGSKVMLRCYQAALGARLDHLLKEPKRAKEAYVKATNDNIRIYDNAVITSRSVEAIVAREKPGLIIFDQIDKIKGFSNDRDDLQLGAIYQWARELGKQYAPVIGVSQASGDGEGVDYLTMSHVANAKTSKQAEADWILGIGKSSRFEMEGIRFLNISKNKLVGDDDTDPALRHGRTEVLFKGDIGRYLQV